MYVQVNDLPSSLVSVLKSLGYGKTDIEIDAQEYVSPSLGSGTGLRAFFAMIDLGTGQVEVKYGSWGGSNMFSPNNQVDNDTSMYNIPPNIVVIRGHEGGGKPVYASVVMRPDMITPFLPLPKDELSPRLQWILDCFATLTSAGRKKEFTSYNHIGPSADEITTLENLGLIKKNKAGSISITTEGRNRKSHCGWCNYVAP